MGSWKPSDVCYLRLQVPGEEGKLWYRGIVVGTLPIVGTLHVHADEDVENVETVEWCRYVGDVFYDSLFGHRQLSAGS